MTRGTLSAGRCRRAPTAKHPLDRVARLGRIDVADDDRRQLAGSKAVAVQLQQPLARELFNRVNRPLRLAAVRMTVGVEEGHQCLGRSDGRVVVILADRRDDLALSDRDLLLRQRRRHDDVAEEREDRLEIL